MALPAKRLESLRSRIREQVLAHMLQRLEATKTCEDPYPHFWLREVFPPEIYQQMLHRQPQDSDFLPQKAERFYKQDGTSTRLQLPVLEHHLVKLPGENGEFWLGIHDVLHSRELKQAVYRKLAAGLMYRYGVAEAAVEDLPGVPAPRFFRERDGYAIAPHPDTRRKIVTLQFALSEDRTQLDLGTGIYVRSLLPGDWLGQPSGFRGFRKVQQYPFEPNSAFAFSVLNSIGKKSWHGREKLAGDCGVRNSILTIYYATQADVDIE
jgi:hypothetical protein